MIWDAHILSKREAFNIVADVALTQPHGNDGSTAMQARHEPTAYSNTHLLRVARTGDKAAWDEIVRRYEGVVRAAVARYRPTATDAADAVQNTWLRLLENAASIRDPEKLGSWLTTTARRECLALKRRQRIERPIDTICTRQPSPCPTPETAVIAMETRRHVRLAINMLADRPRGLINALYFQSSDSYGDVARITGMPIGSIGPTRRRTLRCLHASLHQLLP